MAYHKEHFGYIYTDRNTACSTGQIAEALGISRQRVEQILLRALLKLRAALEERGVTDEVAREELANLEEVRLAQGDTPWERIENG